MKADPPVLETALAAAQAAAQAAGRLIRAASADPSALQIALKRPNDYVTSVDIAAEQAIVSILLEAFPDHAVRGEESAGLQGNAASDHVWIVDPLDGTNNFIHGYPAVAVSIALSVRGRVDIGVVLDVGRGDVYCAQRGGGAQCNGRPLRVSGRAALSESLVASSCPYRPGPAFDGSMRMLGAVMAEVGGIRRSGSAALDLAFVAAGHCEGFFDIGLKAWDVAAGALLVTEAGGRVGRFDGGEDFIDARQCLAGNAPVFAALSALLQPHAGLAALATAA